MTATATPIRECDQALDYLYAMLEGEAKARFEAHLATCPRCTEELEAFGKVRVVAQQSLQTVEPSERLSGALHAQLMHAAAQRKPRGKVVPFLRRVISHPSYAAAAALVLVGGAVGLQYTRGKLMMAPAAQSEQAPAPVAAATPPAPDVPAAAPAPAVTADPAAAQPGATRGTEMLSGENDKSPQQGGSATGKLVVTAEPKSEPKLDGAFREKAGSVEPAKSRTVDKSADYKSTFGAKDADSNGLVEDLTDRRAITARLNKKVATGAKADEAGGPLGGDVAGAGSASGKGYAGPSGAKTPAPAAERGRSSADGHAAPRTETAKEAPPPPAAPQRQAAAPAPSPKPTTVPQKRAPEPAEAKPAPREQEARRDDRNAAPATGTVAQQAARPQADEPVARSTPPANHAAKPRALDDSVNAPVAEAPALSSAATKSNNSDDESVRREPAAKAELEGQDDVDKERSRAAQLAQSGKCSEAAAIYGRLDKKTPERLNAQDRVSYERCLTALGRYDTAQDQLKQMRAGKAQGGLPAAAINAEQKNIDMQRKRAAERNAEAPMANEQRNASRPKKAKAKSSASQSDAYEAAPADNAVKKYSY